MYMYAWLLLTHVFASEIATFAFMMSVNNAFDNYVIVLNKYLVVSIKILLPNQI